MSHNFDLGPTFDFMTKRGKLHVIFFKQIYEIFREILVNKKQKKKQIARLVPVYVIFTCFMSTKRPSSRE